jgi:DnaJ-class molecular chaperone
MSEKDYYKLLGVEKTASEDELKKAKKIIKEIKDKTFKEFIDNYNGVYEKICG